MNSNYCIIIMAGGLGKRMNSTLPKVLHPILGIPMICKLIETAIKTNPSNIFIVVGKYKNIIQQEIEKYFDKTQLDLITYVNQHEPLGTGNAIQSCMKNLSTFKDGNTRVLILSGDTPLVSIDTMNQMLNSSQNLAMVTTYDSHDKKFVDYGKAVVELHENQNIISKIIEKKDCNETQLNINTVNCGIYCFNLEVLNCCINLITNNNKQNEYYLTDLIEIGKNKGYITCEFNLDKNLQHEITGVNTPEQLKELELIILNLVC